MTRRQINRFGAGALLVLAVGVLAGAGPRDVRHHERTGRWALEADLSWLPVAGEQDPPGGLSSPVAVKDLPMDRDLQPFGVVRSSKDTAEVGHGGLDLRMNKDAPLRAVADGVILAIAPVEGQPKESEVLLLLSTGPRPGTGWGFLYSHVRPAPGITVGERVQRGDLVAASFYGDGRSVHLELSYRFQAFLYMRNQTCWVERLSARDQRTLRDWFERLRSREAFTQSWETQEFSGRLPFHALLNPREFPDGPRICYPPGTDVR